MTLQKKIARSVGKNLSFYLTGSILTAITIMLLVGAFAVSHSIYECFTPYFDETRVEDEMCIRDSGGDDSWGAPVHPEYHIDVTKPLTLRFGFRGI